MKERNSTAFIGFPASFGFGVLVLISVISALPVYAHAATYNYVETHDVSYGPNVAQKVDTCIPQGVAAKTPAVVLIHGGGYQWGDKSDFETHCQQFAAHGIAAFNINYRLFTPPATSSSGSNLWPIQLVDSQLAVRWLRAHAATYNIDVNKICADGGSAGGTLAQFLGDLSTNQAGDMTNLYPTQSPKASCVVDFFGATDYTQISTSTMDSLHLFDFFNYGTMGQQGLIDGSPLYDVTTQSSPTLIVQGTQDTLVPFSQSIALQTVLQNAAVPVQYISYNGGHSLVGLTGSQLLDVLNQSITYVASRVGLPYVDVKLNNTDGLLTVASGATTTLSWTSDKTTSCSYTIKAPDGTVFASGNAGLSTSGIPINPRSDLVFSISCVGNNGVTMTDTVGVAMAH